MEADAKIKIDVLAEIHQDPFLQDCSIDLMVDKGIVTLAGKVNSLAQKIHAEKAAAKVKGVRAIAEDIIVELRPDSVRSDTEIAHSVANVLAWNSAVPQDGISVKVENGIVTLVGSVEWEFQRNAAARAISHLRGIRIVNNMITVTPKVSVNDIKSEISSALHRSATVDAEHIDVFVDGSRVTLQGVVASHAARKEVEAAAWNTSGVSHVDSFIEVEEAGISAS